MNSRGKVGHVTGDAAQAGKEDPSMHKWKSKISFIIVWLMNSMRSAIGKAYWCVEHRPKFTELYKKDPKGVSPEYFQRCISELK